MPGCINNCKISGVFIDVYVCNHSNSIPGNSHALGGSLMPVSEGLPGVLGNKGTWPISTREQGNKDKIS